MQHTLDFENKTIDDSLILIPINEEVQINEALGDRIGLSQYNCPVGTPNTLWVMRDYVDADDDDVIEFLKEHIKLSQYNSVLGLIRRVER